MRSEVRSKSGRLIGVTITGKVSDKPKRKARADLLDDNRRPLRHRLKIKAKADKIKQSPDGRNDQKDQA